MLRSIRSSKGEYCEVSLEHVDRLLTSGYPLCLPRSEHWCLADTRLGGVIPRPPAFRLPNFPEEHL